MRVLVRVCGGMFLFAFLLACCFFFLPVCLLDCLFVCFVLDCLFVLFGWLAGWLVGWMVGWLVGFCLLCTYTYTDKSTCTCLVFQELKP